MSSRALARISARTRLASMASDLSPAQANGYHTAFARHSLDELPKSNNFTSKLPTDAEFPTPAASHKAPRDTLGPRLVKGALFTYVRPDVSDIPEIVSVSPLAMRDLGIRDEERDTQKFKDMVGGKKIVTWDETKEEGIYPWAQCYGGWQFGSWAGQLGDGRAISLFESTNSGTKTRYEVQLKGAGRTPYSRFADGKAVVRSSIREYIVSEALNALGIPTTRALALTLLPNAKVVRERVEPGAIVTRFAQSWLRIGTFDLLRSRGDRNLIRQLSTYIGEEVFPGWQSLPARIPAEAIEETTADCVDPPRGVPREKLEGPPDFAESRFARLYREIVRRNAKTVAAWQAYAFTNGVLNTDNTSIFGLSIDFGPFAFLDNFDPMYTPNHDDSMLRYSYRNQPTIIWWNLVRLGEDMGELLGAGDHVDSQEFIEKGVTEDFAPVLIKRAEKIIERAGEEYRAVFLAEYKRLMTKRLGLKSLKEKDFEKLLSEWLDCMEALELDFTNSFRKLSYLEMTELKTEDQRKEAAKKFFHSEGVTGAGESEGSAIERLANWLRDWRARVLEDWGVEEGTEEQRQVEMRAANPKFIPRGWILDELIERVEKKGERDVLDQVMHMALHPFDEEWSFEGKQREDAMRWTGDVPKYSRAMQCSCSS